jgi:hypothetical protein
LYLAIPFPAFAGAESADKGRLNTYEQAVLGKAGGSGSVASRVSALEVELFGKAKTGDVGKRLDAIGAVLGPSGAPPSKPPSEQPSNLQEGPVTSAGSLNSSGGGPVHEGHVTVSDSAGEVDSYLKQGIKQYSEGNYADARASFNRVLKSDPRNCHAMYNLAAIDERFGDLGAALNKYQLALSFNPSDPELQRAVASVRQELAGRAAQDSRRRAELEYQTAAEQERGRHGGRVLQGSATTSTCQPPVFNNSFQPPPVLDVTTPSPNTVSAAPPSEEFHRPRGPSPAKTAAAVGLMVGVGLMSSKVPALGALHCPICRILGAH